MRVFTWLSVRVATVNYTEWNQRSYLFQTTLIWYLLDNEWSDCALVSKDVDLVFTWQREKRLCARFQGRSFDVYFTTSEATVRSFPRTLIWCLLYNEPSDCALVSKDVDLIFTWQRAKRLCARFKGRWFDVYLTTSEATVRSFQRTLIWCLLDNERSDCALLSKDVDLMFTRQRAKRLCARFHDVDLMFTWQRVKRLCARYQGRWFAR